MKVLLAAAGLVFAMMCFALVVIVEVLARLLPVLILAALLWGGWRIWQARRSRPADTPVPLLAPFPAPAPVAMPQPAPIAPPIADPDVYLVAGDHLGMRPPLTPLHTPEATDVQGRVLVLRPHSRVR